MINVKQGESCWIKNPHYKTKYPYSDLDRIGGQINHKDVYLVDVEILTDRFITLRASLRWQYTFKIDVFNQIFLGKV